MASPLPPRTKPRISCCRRGRGRLGALQSLSDWRSQNNIDASKQIKLVKLSHIRYQHPDLDEITRFLQGSCPLVP